jgi:enterochelin esterase family protein
MGRRDRDLTENLPFANFVGEELIPWVRRHYRIKAGPAHVVVAGSSFGGLAASYCAFVHPTSIGNVLSQSGSYWLTSDWQTSTLPSPMDRDRGDLIGEFMKSPRLPIRFYVEVGQLESYQQTSNNREFRDVLRLKGYAVTYHEFDGGHGYLSWRGSLADGLIALLGTRPH